MNENLLVSTSSKESSIDCDFSPLGSILPDAMKGTPTSHDGADLDNALWKNNSTLNFKSGLRQFLPIDPRLISMLSEEERDAIRKQHPDMSQYFYLSQREKVKYFHTLNLNFRRRMKPLKPPGSAPRKKTISFKKRFEIIHFDQEEKCDDLRSQKSFMELYTARDESKPQHLSRVDKRH